MYSHQKNLSSLPLGRISCCKFNVFNCICEKKGPFKKMYIEKKKSHGNNFRNGLFKWQFLRSLHFPKNSSTLLPSANKSKITYIYTMYFLHFYGKKILLPVVNYFCKVLLLQQQQNKSFFFLKKKYFFATSKVLASLSRLAKLGRTFTNRLKI